MVNWHKYLPILKTEWIFQLILFKCRITNILSNLKWECEICINSERSKYSNRMYLKENELHNSLELQFKFFKFSQMK